MTQRPLEGMPDGSEHPRVLLSKGRLRSLGGGEGYSSLGKADADD